MNSIADFDVLLSHNGKEASLAVEIGNHLRKRGLRVWLDTWQLRPGLSWQDGILEGLSHSASCAVLIGQAGYGGWHKKEMEAALLRQGPDYPVIPILLPGAPDRAEIGAFLSLLTWVDFRAGADDPEALDRLIWGITGIRPSDALDVPTLESGSRSHASGLDCRFRVVSPRNGDLLIGPSIISGIGPPNERVFLDFRSPDGEDLLLGASTDTDKTGKWAVFGFQLPWSSEPHPGPYELYAAGVEGRARSQPVTVFYRDSSNVTRVARRIGTRARGVEVSYELRAAFIEATKLKNGRLIASGRVEGFVENVESIATSIGESIARKLQNQVAQGELTVRLMVDRAGKLSFEPSTAWASYYAFPRSFRPATDVQSLRAMRETQMAWRLTPHVGQIPRNPFGDDYRTTSAYLEVRHEGYRPEFIPLGGTEATEYECRLSPVLNKRIAVLDFPSIDPAVQVGGLSQLIAREVISAIERCPELATFGYLSDAPRQRGAPRDFFEELGRPQIEMGNEVLNLHDVQAMEEQLESVDTSMVSGQGRFLTRQALDIQFAVRGYYRVVGDASERTT